MLADLSAKTLAGKLAAKEISCREAALEHLSRIARLNSELNAFITVCEQECLSQADAAQALIDSGDAGPLTGVPIALKDNISTRDIRTTCASNMLRSYIPPYDATVAEKLKAEGLVVLGKTNMDEFAMGGSTETGAFGVCHNPWAPSRSAGGSSGGSAAAVSAGMAPLALGSDTGGSIRQPASLCGVVGFKPTYGRCSRFGLVAFASSLDQIGPIARSVEDAAWCAQAITGHDRREATSLPLPPIDASRVSQGSLKGKRFGVPKQLTGESFAPAVIAVLESAIKAFESAGASVEEIDLPTIAYGVTTYYIIAPAEASSNLARFDGVRFGHRAEGKDHIHFVERSRAEGFGHEVKMRVLIGTYALSAGYYDAYYGKATQVRARMAAEFDQALRGFDAILSPTCPITAFELGSLSDDPLAIKLLDYCAIPANMGGFPAISIPGGLSEGLPVGLQLLGKRSQDEALLALAFAAEQSLGATAKPPVA